MWGGARNSSPFPCDSAPKHARFPGHARTCGRFDVLATTRRLRDRRLGRRTERRAERPCPDHVRQSVARHAPRLLRPPVPERVSSRLALGRGRFRGAACTLSAHAGSRLCVRADHDGDGDGRAARAGLSVRPRFDDRALAVAATSRARRFARRRHRVAGASLDPAATSRTTGAPLRFRAVVSEGRRVRQVRLGRPSALSRGRVLRRVRELRRDARSDCGPGGWGDRCAG